MWCDTTDPNVFGELMLKMLKGRETIIKTIMADIDKSEKNLQGLIDVIPSLDDGSNLAHQLKTVAQLAAQQQKTNKLLLMLALVYMQGDQFKADAAGMASKFGMGKEALQELWKQKLEGT